MAIIGGGPAGLAAAYHLTQCGHACTIFDDHAELGGMLGREIPEAKLPRDVLQREIEQILRLGIEVLGNIRGRPRCFLRGSADRLRCRGDRCRMDGRGAGPALGTASYGRAIAAKHRTYETNLPGVFAVGNALRGQGTTAIRSVADAKEAPWPSISSDGSAGHGHKSVVHHSHRQDGARREKYYWRRRPRRPRAVTVGRPSQAVPPNWTDSEVRPTGRTRRSRRPVVCTATAGRSPPAGCENMRHVRRRSPPFQIPRRPYEQDTRHAEILFEPGKCIDCGLCVQITAAGGEELGLTYIGRGFDVRIGVPLGHSAAEALTKVAAECVAACPTAAIAWKND